MNAQAQEIVDDVIIPDELTPGEYVLGFRWDCEEAIAVATCESNMNPRAVSPPNTNGTIDRGLFQVNDVWKDAWAPEVWDRIFVARTNIGMAYHAWKVGGNSWKYWTCQP